MGLPRKIFYFTVACLLVFTFSIQGYGKTTAGLVKEGNNAYNAEEYDNAVTAYDEALKEAPDSPYAYFNKGAALFKKGDYAGAAEAFETAVFKSKDRQFEAKTKFNLGNTAYKEAEGMKGEDLQKALEGCSKSVSYYQDALRLDPDMKEAAENMEMVRLVMKNILDEIQKQKEAEEKDREKKDEAVEKLKKLIKEQENALEKNKQLQKELAEKGDANELNSNIGELADEQKTIRDKTDALSKEWPTPSASKHLENAVKEQDAAYGNLGLKNTKEAAKNQEDAIKELKDALDSQQEDSNNGAEQDNQDQQGKEQGQQQEASPDTQKGATDQMQEQASMANLSEEAQDILNDEKENKEQRKAAIIKSYKEVDKDW